MRYIYLLIILCCFSCNNERVLYLPEIENAEITEVLDVSPAYIFYDETEPDSTLLNRKNLISTTNWLVNVDKRLTLKQAIPKIILMQEKKRNAKMHKNENAKNYFTCNDTSIGNLGFIEFTDIVFKENIKIDTVYHKNNMPTKENLMNTAGLNAQSTIPLIFNKTDQFQIGEQESNINKLKNELDKLTAINFIGIHLLLYFDENLTFQDYITIKRRVKSLNSDLITVDLNEFIY
ncbi:hypothetical protein ADIWIN_2427 [Winogradskyella psychrotolerans RS-3]|uniref:Uncharacterized protein n=1 Tax=Winogradskyella psychrotolerans RS-3 TaxID=641526 RepID=S7VT45_9FLAO|nr:hypothetical protein [Winogradskyella psychrotolerans]EPR72537.1 hypothetical protein ADIWIN_2427 [Winogradskyella psychrotolerans RS-3]